MAEKLWGGRFREEMDESFRSFNSSFSFDRRLLRHDIEGSIAHCRALKEAGILSEEEHERIIEALSEIRREIERGDLELSDSYEDIHSFIEAALIDKVGALGEKLHTARSRNDQVALDLRLFLKEEIQETIERIKRLQKRIIELAKENMGLILPGYTHLQRAQPVLLSHHLHAYYEMLKRDRERFLYTLKACNVLPLGSAALAGTPFPISRDLVARELRMDAISSNSMDAVSDRDFALDFLYSCAVLMMHLSRFSEELILWSTQEFGFVELPDSLSTGSSIMPQKKNPDIVELIRAKTGRVYGNLISLLTTMKALPLTYNKDMQEDKECVFDSLDTVKGCLEMMTILISKIRFKEDRLKEVSAEGYLLATDLADYLVYKGVTFRSAHEITGRIVLYAMDKGKELDELTLEEFLKFSRKIEDDIYDWLDIHKSIERKRLPGGTSMETVKRNLSEAEKEISS